MNRCLLRILLVLTASLLPAQDDDEAVLDLEGEGLNVVGTEELNQQVQIVDQEQIVRTQAPDVPTLLERTLGLAMTRNGGYGNVSGVSLRGFGSGRVAILIDGVPVNSAQSGEFDLSRVQVSSLGRIEVISGGSDTKYNINGAIGGVINLITMKNPGQGLHWGASLSNKASYPGAGSSSPFDTQSVNIQFAQAEDDGFWTLDLAANRAVNEYAFWDQSGTARWWKGNGVTDAGIAATLGRDLADERRLLVSANGYYGSKSIPGPVNSASPGRQTDLNTRSSVVWSDASVGTDTLGTNVTLSHRLTYLEWTDPTIHSLHALNTVGLVNRWDWSPTEGFSLQAGADFDYSLLSSNTVGLVKDYSGGFYATLPFSPAPQWQVVPSVKEVFAEGLNQPVTVPKLGLVYRIDDHSSVKNNYFRTFKLPSINDRYWPEDSFARGNPDLKAEDGVGADLIFASEVPGWFSSESSWFASRQQNAIMWQPAGGKWSPQNIGEAVYWGTDNSVKTTVSRTWTLTARYSFLMTWVLTGGLTLADDVRMPYKPAHTAGFEAAYHWNSGSASVTGHFEGERFISLANLTSLAPFFTLDASVDQKLGGDVTLFATVKNFLNQNYSTVEGYPMPGGSVTVGLRYDTTKLTRPGP